MATSTSELIQMLQREVNTPGIEMLPDLGPASAIGYIEDGFWDARLAGILSAYTIVDFGDVVPPETAGRWIVDQASHAEDLPFEYQMMVVIFAGVRLIRNKILNLAINFRAKAGAVEFEQQASATTLRAVLAVLQQRLAELKGQYSDSLPPGAFNYMDAVLQREVSLIGDVAILTVY